MNFPNSRQQNLELAHEVIKTLKARSGEPSRWTEENFRTLRELAERRSCGFFHKSIDGSKGNEFLWDFTAFIPGAGLLFTIESELWTRNQDALLHDFEKLLYARCPVKVMVFAVNRKEGDATEKVERFKKYLRENCSIFNPGEVYVIYAADGTSVKNDQAYVFQALGEPNLQFDKDPQFALHEFVQEEPNQPVIGGYLLRPDHASAVA